MNKPDLKTLAARLRALAAPHSFAFHGWLAWHPDDSGEDEVRIDDRDLQAELIALAEELDPSCRGHVMPLEDPHGTRLEFTALDLPRSAADPRPAA